MWLDYNACKLLNECQFPTGPSAPGRLHVATCPWAKARPQHACAPPVSMPGSTVAVFLLFSPINLHVHVSTIKAGSFLVSLKLKSLFDC